MKIILLLLSVLSLSTKLSAQVEYEITKDTEQPHGKILRGTIDKHLLQNDSTFKWYTSSQKIYTPDSTILNTLKKAKTANLQLVIFGGTWCEDTQFILPKFFKLQEMSGLPDANITLFGVNRSKVSLGHIAEAFGIEYVPTIIVMKAGKELGRVVEYGKTGKWDKELADIISSE